MLQQRKPAPDRVEKARAVLGYRQAPKPLSEDLVNRFLSKSDDQPSVLAGR